MINSFSTLGLDTAMLANLESLGYTRMTPIQEKSLPVILAGKDLIAQAKTGSGKTLAFGLGLLSSLDVREFRVQSLVLCPTRELADQVAKELRRLARAQHNVKVLLLCGGVAIGPQLGSLEHGAHIVVGTPGRILDHLRKTSLKLDSLKQLVLDEADRMLDMGFAEDLKTILAACPSQRQTLLFSATYPDEIEKISAGYQQQPVRIQVDAEHGERQLAQRFFELPADGSRISACIDLLAIHKPESAIIFCNTKQACEQLYQGLRQAQIAALVLHGDLEQRERDQVLVRFANQNCRLLIATDVAARGLDVKRLDAVISYDLTRDPEVHVHRVGRTGRAGETGLALALVAPEEMPRFNRLEDYLAKRLSLESLPQTHEKYDLVPEMVTLELDGGKKHKLRPGDILGALTKDAGLSAQDIGKIDVFDFCTYVAVRRSLGKKALQHFQQGKIKGRKFRARLLGDGRQDF